MVAAAMVVGVAEAMVMAMTVHARNNAYATRTQHARNTHAILSL